METLALLMDFLQWMIGLVSSLIQNQMQRINRRRTAQEKIDLYTSLGIKAYNQANGNITALPPIAEKLPNE